MYSDAIEGVPYRAIDELQPAPFANLTFGGGGTAYVLWRLGKLRSARRWLAASLADRRAAALQLQRHKLPTLNFLHGRGGLYWLRLILESKPQPRSIDAFARGARSRAGDNELVTGAAGYLNGIRLLLARRDDTRLRALGNTLAAGLLRRLERRAREPWQAIDAAGFAHYWPGTVFVLLAWARATGELDPALADAARGLLAVWSPELTRVTGLHATWCNGAAGAALLWAKAYEVIGDDAFRKAARVAAERAQGDGTSGSDLCCGQGGVAYALLALERIDPGAGWRDLAYERAIRAIEQRALTWPNGLHRGHPGLVCLALDLLAERPVGFPAIEG